MSELLVNTIKKADGTGSLTVPAESGTVVTTASPSLGRRNLIINGAMQVAQRGTSFTSLATGTYALDRYQFYRSGGGNWNVEQSTDAPDNFKNSVKITVSTADSSIAAGDYYLFGQKIEGQNMSHLNFGSSAAQTVTLSFQVKSSLTGTFSGVLTNSAENRSYPFTYSISTANTWEAKTVTVAGDTSGTWLDTNNIGMEVWFDMGSGTTYQGTAGAWAGATYYAASSSTQLIGTASATFQITGVQLEVGSVATPFEHRSYGEELALCQRYFQRAVDNDTGDNLSTGANQAGTTAVRFVWPLSVPLRASPTVSQTGTGWKMFAYNTSNGSTNTPTVYRHTVDAGYIGLQVNNYSGLSDNRVCTTSPQNLTKLDFDSEL